MGQQVVKSSKHILNTLDVNQLKDVMAMAVSEKRPIDVAYSNWYYAQERQIYNDYLSRLDLDKYHIKDNCKELTFTQKEVEDAIFSRISSETDVAQKNLKKFKILGIKKDEICYLSYHLIIGHF